MDSSRRRFRIKEVSSMYDVTAHNLRYYKDTGLIKIYITVKYY
ncbi:MerR family transcriptional regulator [Desulfofarcimen acetoxidans]